MMGIWNIRIYVIIYIFNIQSMLDSTQKKDEGGIGSIFGHTHFRAFLIYCFAFMMLGTIMVGLGPFIPYLAEKQHIVETDYSFLFFARAFGFLSGALSVKLVENRFTYHQLLGIGYFMTGMFIMLFNFSENSFLRAVFIYLSSAGSCYSGLFANMATIEGFKGQNMDKWLQFLHACYGVGGLLGPYIIYLLEFKAFLILGLLTLCLTFFILRQKSPQDKKQERLLERDIGSEIQEARQSGKKEIYISKYCTFLLCFSFLFVVGQQTSYGTWVPSYAVLRNFSPKEHATFYSSLYWISITSFRFAFVLISGKVATKIYVLTSIGVLCAIFSPLIIFNSSPELGLIFASIVFGLSNSALFPLLLGLGPQFGLSITPTENSYFMLFTSMGEGIVSVCTGYLMSIFTYEMLFITMGLMNFVALCNHWYTCKVMKEEKENATKYIELRSM